MQSGFDAGLISELTLLRTQALFRAIAEASGAEWLQGPLAPASIHRRRTPLFYPHSRLDQEGPLPLAHWTSIGFTGHRHLADAEVVREAVRGVLNRLAAIAPRLTGISSAASGSDTLFAEEFAARGLPFALVLPFPRERFSQDFQNEPDNWNRVCALLGKAIHVDVVHPVTAPAENGCTPPTAGDQHALDAAAYMDAGYRTIDRAEVVIAVWDGQPANGFGGTADAIKYARDLEKPLFIIHPSNGRVLEERIAAWQSHLPAHSAAQPAEPVALPANPRAAAEEFFKECNREAGHHGPRSRYLIRLCLHLLLVASTLGFIKLIFEPAAAIKWALTIAGALVLVVASVLAFLRGKSYDRWIKARVKAEVARSFLATWDIRRHATLSHQPRPAIPGHASLFADLRLLRQMDRTPLLDMDEARSSYNSSRVQHQIDYFRFQRNKARHSLKRRKILMSICSFVALGCSITMLILPWFITIPELDARWIEFAEYTLPLLTTALGLTLITEESSRRASRCTEMIDALVHLQRRLLASATWDSLARIVTEVEEELLQEVIEWRSFVRFTRDIAHHG